MPLTCLRDEWIHMEMFAHLSTPAKWFLSLLTPPTNPHKAHTFLIDKTQNGNHNKRIRQQCDVSNDDDDDDVDLSENSMFTFHFHLIRGASIYFARK